MIQNEHIKQASLFTPNKCFVYSNVLDKRSYCHFVLRKLIVNKHTLQDRTINKETLNTPSIMFSKVQSFKYQKYEKTAVLTRVRALEGFKIL